MLLKNSNGQVSRLFLKSRDLSSEFRGKGTVFRVFLGVQA
jgi:hypothetical protein